MGVPAIFHVDVLSDLYLRRQRLNAHQEQLMLSIQFVQATLRNVAREASRVLKNGGMFLHMDAVQMKDDTSVAATTRVAFDASFNEPFMMNWTEKVDLDAIFAVEGFEPVGPARPYLRPR